MNLNFTIAFLLIRKTGKLGMTDLRVRWGDWGNEEMGEIPVMLVMEGGGGE